MDFFYWFTHQFDFGGDMASTIQYKEWYGALVKPFFAPEPWVFGVAWGIIYPLIAIAAFWALFRFFRKHLPRRFIALFFLNILLNLSFTPMLIVTRNNELISAVILLVLATLVFIELFAWKHSKVIFWLLVPYLLWGAFATVLQLTITALN